MHTEHILALDTLSSLTLKDLRTANPELYQQVQERIASKRSSVITAAFASTSQGLRDVLRKIDLAPGDRLDCGLTQIILEGLTAQCAAPELLQEVLARIRTLDGSSALNDPAEIHLPLADHPLFQRELQQASLIKLAGAIRLPERKTAQLSQRVESVATLNEGILRSLIKEGTLTKTEARKLGLATSVFNIVDAQLPLVQALQNGSFPSLGGKKLTELRALTRLSVADWQTAITRARAQPPDGLNTGAYAAELSRRVAALFPTDALLQRTLPKSPAVISTALGHLKPLFEHNKAVFGTTFDTLNHDGLSASALSDLRTAHTELQELANMHPGLGLGSILNSSETAEQKAAQISARLALIDELVKANPDVELLALDYAPGSADLAKLKFGRMDRQQQALVLANLKAHQRAFALTDNADHARALLAAGYHTAATVAGRTFAAFQRASGLDPSVAEPIYRKARTSLAEVTLAASSVIDVVRGGFSSLGVTNLPPALQDYLKTIGGFSELFGSQDYCQCDHCRSILSPAAYFVDLMHFVKEHVSDATFTGAHHNHVLSLKQRRPDLWTLPLTCENTNTLIPSLDIINEILENAIAQLHHFSGDLRDRGGVEQVVYQQTLASAVNSFKQPFCLPLVSLSLYLTHFDCTRADIARTLGAPSATATAAVLQVSKEAFHQITTENTSPTFLHNLYGASFTVQANHTIAPFDAQKLLRFTGLSRDELGQLAASRFISANGAEAFEIRAEKRDSDSIQNDIERVHKLRLTTLDRLHRFTRLWRSLPWSIPELDLVLTQLGGAGSLLQFTPQTLERIVRVLTIGERRSLSVEQNCALWSDIPLVGTTEGASSLFERLFNLPPFDQLDGQLPKQTMMFVHPAFRSSGQPLPADTTLHRLLAGLQISSEQLALLIRVLAEPLDAQLTATSEDQRGFLLTVANLSLLYRHARLLQLLGASVADLFQMIGYAGMTGGYIANLDDLDRLLTFHDWWSTSGYSLADLALITRKPGGLAAAPDLATGAAQLVARVQQDKVLAFADTLFAFVPGVTEAQSRALIKDNATVITMVGDGADSVLLRITDTFDPSAPLAVPAGITASEADLRAVLLLHHTSTVLPMYMATYLGLPVEHVAALIKMTGVDLASAAFSQALWGKVPQPIIDLLDKLLPLARLFDNTIFDGPVLAFIQAHPDVFGINDFNALTVETIRRVALYADQVDTADQANFTPNQPLIHPEDVRQVLAAFTQGKGFADADQQTLARTLHADTTLVATLVPNLSLPSSALDALVLLQQVVILAQKLGVGGETLRLICSDAYTDLQQASQAVLRAIRVASSSEQAFLDTLEPLEDQLRSRRRDALAEYLLRSAPLSQSHPPSRLRNGLGQLPVGTTHPAFETLDDLYAYFLVDVQLEGCARTSRLVAAISSVQLYVHRCLMHLEQDRRQQDDPHHIEVRPDRIPSQEWAWRKNYRVWEANRKVFLYPENYIEPELRDDKTPLFSELEAALLQQQIDEQHVLDAYSSYLSGFEEVAKLTLAGSYHDIHYKSKRDVLHLFGVTTSDPPVYYYRMIENAYHSEVIDHCGIVYHPWRKIDVQIPVRRVAPIVYLGRLFVFWVEIVTTPKNHIEKDSSKFDGYKHRMILKYASLRLDGQLSSPQVISLKSDIFQGSDGIVEDLLLQNNESKELLSADILKILSPEARDAFINMFPSAWIPQFDERYHFEPLDGYTLNGFQWNQVYPENSVTKLCLNGRNFMMRASVDFYRHSIEARGEPKNVTTSPTQLLCAQNQANGLYLYYGIQPLGFIDLYAHASLIADDRRLAKVQQSGETPLPSLTDTAGLYVEQIAKLSERAEIHVINGSCEDAIIDINGDLLLLQGSVRSGPGYLIKRLSTTLGEQLVRTLFTGGVEALLALDNQQTLGEASLPLTLLAQIEQADKTGVLNFKGPFGTYYREIFFHIPFLLANQLNSQGRFAAAQQWYHYIFNPTASESDKLPAGLSAEEQAQRQRDRVWRYREFRNLDIPSLRDILTQQEAIEAYKADPFNPHAIARLRPSAYQKSVVMKYIDNLLDWGDSLFTQFTMESVNEATLLYVLASDILGPRPAQLGSCGEPNSTSLTYKQLEPLMHPGSDFLLELETIQIGSASPARARSSSGMISKLMIDATEAHFYQRVSAPAEQDSRQTEDNSTAATGLMQGYRWNQTRAASWTSANGRASRVLVNDSPLIKDFERVPNFGWSFLRQLSPAFCVPENKELRAYWDRVEDRLYKIRHCMDITGTRRQLALFAPEIDPRLLVRAQAAGLSIEDVLNATSGNLPPYRFTYLIEKARQYAATVQSFGSALLSALEKRDTDALQRLQTVHQQHLLALTTRTREQEITIADDGIAGLERQLATVQYRRDYYQGLLDSGLSAWEHTEQAARHTASLMHITEATLGFLSASLHLLPQIGSPFAMKYGGKETGDSTFRFAVGMRATADFAEALAASTGLEATFDRRSDEWKHQVKLADHELKQLEKQLAAAKLHKEIALRALDIHTKTIEQTEEIFDFYNERFTNLGLYTWLATTLQRVYREAYQSAYTMARLAEQAFRFERGDDPTPLLQTDAWDGSKAGLLAGDQLLIDLQQMERRFVETNYRTIEISQPFALTQIAPAALMQLRETGSCTFSIPELFFDLFYPGQYRRRIRSVHLTIPCVTGPYTNVGATLSLVSSKIRSEPKLAGTFLKDVPLRRSVAVATSTAQHDAGVFEFSFRDERYMPFEGAGAISSWNLALPKSFRAFDYQTISDVILHISYQAEADGIFRESVEALNEKTTGTILNNLSNHPIAQVFSLRRDFASALHSLLRGGPVTIQFTDQYQPIFFRGHNVLVTQAILLLQTPTTQPASGVQVVVDGANLSNFAQDIQFGSAWSKDLDASFCTNFFGTHTLEFVSTGDLAPEGGQSGNVSAVDASKLLDVLIYIQYQIAK